MAGSLIECVPNFSEGRDPSVLEAVVGAISSAAGVYLLRQEMDADHNRSVVTFAADADNVAEGAFRGIQAAASRIDLRRHSGVHPRIGAADIVPFVPLRSASMDDCVRVAHGLGARVWAELGVPVYFYEHAARGADRRRLENVRRGGFEHPSLAPDLGGPGLSPTAGACVIGARNLLIAFNVNLQSRDLRIARAIARTIRESSGGLRSLKAIGVDLPTRGMVQVSMNLTDFRHSPLDVVLNAVREQAGRHGVTVAGTEYIGLVPRQAIEDAASRDPAWKRFDSELILENRLKSAGAIE